MLRFHGEISFPICSLPRIRSAASSTMSLRNTMLNASSLNPLLQLFRPFAYEIGMHRYIDKARLIKDKDDPDTRMISGQCSSVEN